MPYKNKAIQRAYQLRSVKKRRADYIGKMGGKCSSCGSTEQLEIDHIDPETKTDHRIWSWSHPRIEKELEKCQLLCRSCHVEKTARENAERNIREIVHGTYYAYKHRGCRCSDCYRVY